MTIVCTHIQSLYRTRPAHAAAAAASPDVPPSLALR